MSVAISGIIRVPKTLKSVVLKRNKLVYNKMQKKRDSLSPWICQFYRFRMRGSVT